MYIGNLTNNLVADTDLYKYCHWRFINQKLQKEYSYMEARHGAKYPETLFFGLDPIIQRYLMQPVTKEDLAMASAISIAAIGYDAVDHKTWERVVELGYLPITIKAVPEGTAVPVGNVLFTIESNEEWFARSTQLLETTLMRTWYPSSILTRSARIKRSIYPLFVKTGTPELLDHLVVDFGLRGATSMEAAELGGMAHLIAFLSTDNARAIRGLHAYYGPSGKAKSDLNPYGLRCSTIAASEHSVALSYGRLGEKDYIMNMLTGFGDVNVSIVIDTYDPHGLIRNVVADESIKRLITDRSARVVLRPDSGEPKVIVMQVIELLSEIFGYHRNEKEYKVLNSNVGVIQGDGMDEDSIEELYTVLINAGWSADNLAVGSGGGLLQKDITRDTQRFAIKPSYGIIDGVPFNFKKNPTTDPTKASKSGMLKLHPTYDGSFTTISSADNSEASFKAFVDVLRVVYKDGNFFPQDLDDIIKRVDKFVTKR